MLCRGIEKDSVLKKENDSTSTEEHKTYSTNRHAKCNLFRAYTLYYSYCIISWGSSSYANKLFILQKKIVRIITNTRPRDSCRGFQEYGNNVIFSVYIFMFYTQLIINTYLIQIMKFINIKLGITIINTLQ